MSIAVENTVITEGRPRAGLDQIQAARADSPPIIEPELAAQAAVEDWELHSELVLVCPDLRRRARQSLPERDPDEFLARVPHPLPRACPDGQNLCERGLWARSFIYAGQRFVDLVRLGLIMIGALVLLVSLADVVVRT